MKLSRRAVFTGTAGFLAAALAIPSIGHTAEFNWRLQSNLNAGTPGFESVRVAFVERLDRMSGGRMKVQMFPVGSLFPVKEGLEAVGSGVTEIGMMTGGYFTGKMGPIAVLESGVPGAERNSTERYAFFYHKGFIDLAREAYEKHNVFYLGPNLSTPWEIISKKPIRGMKDFDGLKIRCFGIEAQWYESMGASGVFLSGSEIYTALSTGVVDAVRWGSPQQNFKVGLHEVGKYYIQPAPMPAPNNNILINMDAWNTLPDDIKEMMDLAARMSSMEYLAGSTSKDASALKQMQESGMEVVTIPADEWARMEQNVRKIWSAYADEDELAARGVALLKEFLKDLGRM
jgi:TRAP-type mannitol/chloroaromatic compound transport system substrate-binding protein